MKTLPILAAAAVVTAVAARRFRPTAAQLVSGTRLVKPAVFQAAFDPDRYTKAELDALVRGLVAVCAERPRLITEAMNVVGRLDFDTATGFIKPLISHPNKQVKCDFATNRAVNAWARANKDQLDAARRKQGDPCTHVDPGSPLTLVDIVNATPSSDFSEIRTQIQESDRYVTDVERDPSQLSRAFREVAQKGPDAQARFVCRVLRSDNKQLKADAVANREIVAWAQRNKRAVMTHRAAVEVFS